MPRALAPCGTYSAYKRHQRRGESVDPACRRAQKEHDADRSTSASARQQRAARGSAARPHDEPIIVPPAQLTDEGHIARVEELKGMYQESQELVKILKRSDPARAYLQMRESREILREISELQGNGQVKGVTLADQLADARARRRAAAEAS